MNQDITTTAVQADGLDDPKLAGEWFAVAWSREVRPGQLLARRLLGRDVVLWRRRKAFTVGAIYASTGVPSFRWAECAAIAWCVLIMRGNTTQRPVCAHPFSTRPATSTQGAGPNVPGAGTLRHCLGLRGRTVGDLPRFAMETTPASRLMLAGPYFFRAKGPRVVENFLDVAHLGFVHAGLLGDPQHGEIEDYEVAWERKDRRRARFASGSQTGRYRQRRLVTYHYWACSPLTVGLEKLHHDQRFGILAQVAPVDAEPANRAW